MERSVTFALRRSWAIVFVALLSAAGCQKVRADSGSGFDASRPRAWLPILYYQVSRTEDEVARCMKRKGFKYIRRAPADVVQVINIDEVDPMTEARDHGFHLWTDEAPHSKDKNLVYVQSLTRSELDAYGKALSDPEIGCIAEAGRKLVGLIDQVYSLRSEFRSRVANDRRMLSVRSGVASCMLTATGAKGLTNRVDAVRWLRANHPKNVDTERRTAVALARCESKFRATIVAVEQQQARRFAADQDHDLAPLLRKSSSA
jgi:hypothetical protein